MRIVSHLQLEGGKKQRRREDMFGQPAIVAAGVADFHRAGFQEEEQTKAQRFLPLWIALALCDRLSDNK